jgi:predicted component of type VI protein secretion system
VSDEQIPNWAIELIKQSTETNTKVTSLSEWIERNIKDFEMRLRALEQFKWVLIGVSLASGGVAAGLMKMIGG